MTPLRVLVASDSSERTKDLVEILQQAGFEVLLHTGMAGVGEAILERLPDMTVLDAPKVPNTTDSAAGARGVPSWVPRSLEEIERSHIVATLRHTEGNKRRAAQLLGIARSTLIHKVRRYGITGPGEETGTP